MFISDKISLRVKDALPRRRGEGNPFWDSGLLADVSSFWTTMFVDGLVDAVVLNRGLEWCDLCVVGNDGLMLNADTSIPGFIEWFREVGERERLA